MPSKDNGLYEDYLAGSYSWSPPRRDPRTFTLYQDDLLVPTPEGISEYQNQMGLSSGPFASEDSPDWDFRIALAIMHLGSHDNPLNVGEVLDRYAGSGRGSMPSQEKAIRTIVGLVGKGWIVIEEAEGPEESY